MFSYLLELEQNSFISLYERMDTVVLSVSLSAIFLYLVFKAHGILDDLHKINLANVPVSVLTQVRVKFPEQLEFVFLCHITTKA